MFQEMPAAGSGGGSSIIKIPLNGTATATQDNANAYKAFDGNTSTKWVSDQSASGATLYYHFPSAIKANLFSIIGNIDTPYLCPTKVVVYGSNDNSNWTYIAETSIIPADAEKHWIIGLNTTDYSYYRFDLTSRTNGGYTYSQVSSIEMYFIDLSNVIS